MEDSFSLIAQIIGSVGSVIAAVWFLSSRIQSLEGHLDTAVARMEQRLETFSTTMAHQSQLLEETRSSRDRIREDVNSIRERLVALETTVTSLKEEHSPTS